MVTSGERWGMGETGDGGTCQDEHWVMYGSVERLHCTSEINTVLYVNYTGSKIKVFN